MSADPVKTFLDSVLETLSATADPAHRLVFNSTLPKRSAKQLLALRLRSPRALDPSRIQPDMEKSWIRDSWAAKGNYTPCAAVSGMLNPDSAHAASSRLKNINVLAVAQAGPGRWSIIAETAAKPAKIAASTLAAPGWASCEEGADEWSLAPEVDVVEKNAMWEFLLAELGPRRCRPDTLAISIYEAAVRGLRPEAFR